MPDKARPTDYAEKLQSLLNKNKQIIKDLEDGKLTTQEASDRVTKLSIEIKALTAGSAGNKTKAN